jgi:hypothetical protein
VGELREREDIEDKHGVQFIPISGSDIAVIAHASVIDEESGSGGESQERIDERDEEIRIRQVACKDRDLDEGMDLADSFSDSLQFILATSDQD